MDARSPCCYGGGSVSLLDGSDADPEPLSSLLLDKLPDELPLSEPGPELLDDVEPPLVASPDDDSSATLLEGGSMSEPLGESPLDEEMSLPLEPGELEPLPETSLLLSSTSLELGSIELDDGAALEDPLEWPEELDE